MDAPGRVNITLKLVIVGNPTIVLTHHDKPKMGGGTPPPPTPIIIKESRFSIRYGIIRILILILK